LGVNFDFEKAPLKLQRAIKSNFFLKNNEEKQEGKIEGGALGCLWKNRNHRGSVIFWSPTKAHQKEHSDLRQPRNF